MRQRHSDYDLFTIQKVRPNHSEEFDIHKRELPRDAVDIV